MEDSDKKPYTILIVEDDVSMQQALRERLHDEGFKILVSADADGALALLKQNQVDLLLLDLRLGDKSGLDLMDEMKDDPDLEDEKIEVVVLTAIADPAMVGDVMGRGPADYLVKSDNSLDDIAGHIRKKLANG